MCYTERFDALCCKRCCVVIEFRQSRSIRCEEQDSNHLSAYCIERDWTVVDVVENTAAEFFPEAYCINCQPTIFKEKAAEATFTQLAKSFDVHIGNDNINSAFPQMSEAETKRLTKPKPKASIFICRKQLKNTKNSDIKTADPLHKTSGGRITKVGDKSSIQVNTHLLDSLMESMDLN